jgi:hypothetical protein
MNHEKCHNRNIMNIAVCGFLTPCTIDIHTHVCVWVCLCLWCMIQGTSRLKAIDSTHTYTFTCVCVCVCVCICVSVNLNQWFITRNTKGGHITLLLTSCLTGLESAVWQLTIFCYYLQNRLIRTSQTGGQLYSDTSPFSAPWFIISRTTEIYILNVNSVLQDQGSRRGGHQASPGTNLTRLFTSLTNNFKII